MIERHPDIPDNIIELERHETIGDYARAYGDQLARMYEDLNFIVFPHFPLKIDLYPFQNISFPAPLMKIGTANGLEEDIFTRTGDKISVDQDHLLLRAFGDIRLASYIRSQIFSVNAQVREALRVLFPRYFSLAPVNQTWRLAPADDILIHLDRFDTTTQTPVSKRPHRLKFFINIDAQPREWITSYTLPEVLMRRRDRFPDVLPNDINAVNQTIFSNSVYAGAPHHQINYPTLSAVFGNGEAVSHGVIKGDRVIGGEFFCYPSDMLDPAKNTHSQLPQWLEDAGISVGPDNVDP
ncbi:MAG: hypothetical protein P8L79_15990 [Rhodospirillaceae bacterium]|jgi:hypothetical protein|nr:hypothetical protein [Rhodospirillaceae bacterium]